MKKIAHILWAVMIASALIGGVATVPALATPSDWSVPMTATTATEGNNLDLELGVRTGATDGYDSGIDIPHPPPGPGITFDAYFPVSHPIFTGLDKDYRGESESIEWTLHAESDNEDITLAWDASGVPAGTSLRLIGNGPDIDMKAVPSTILTAGSHTLTIEATTAPVNTPPVLSGGQVDPDTGYVTTDFTYTVTYTDADNDAPASITVSINGGDPVAMSPASGGDGDYTNGEVYEYITSGLAKDESHTYQFTASDGTDDATGDTGVHAGPVVSNTPPELSGGQVDPGIGYVTTDFTYSVTYTDADDDEPTSITVSIDDGDPVAMAPASGGDGDYTNGEVYEYTTSGLAKDESHTYQFAASDGTDDATDDTGIHDGPTVVNSPPDADAGEDQRALIETEVTLYGSGSSDADGDEIATYQWVWTDGPVEVTLENATSVNATFTAPTEAGDYTFSLVVNDGTVDSEADYVVVTVKTSNIAPELSDAKVIPATGSTSDIFTYSVNFTDADNESPLPMPITIRINGGDPQDMSIKAGGDGDYTNGEIFEYTIDGSVLGAGTHSYQFIASDGIYPATGDNGTLTGPTVSAPSPPPGGGAPGGGGGAPPTPGVTDVREFVTSQGVFRQDVTATSEDGMVELIIKKGTTGKKADGSALTKISILPVEEPPPPPADSNIIGLVYDLGPDGATFEEPAATLKIKYSLPEGVNPADLVIAIWDEDVGEWVKCEGCVISTTDNTISVPISHFTKFGIITEKREVVTPLRPASFSTRDLTVSPAEVTAGEPVSISIKVTNTGGKSGSYTVRLKINGVEEQTEAISLSAGASEIVSFTVSKDVAGTYEVEIAGKSTTFVVMEPLKPAAFSVGDLTISPAEVVAGESATISVKVTNTGETTGSYTLRLKINGVVEQTEAVTLAAGASQTVSFTVSKDTKGDYEVEIADQTAEFRVLPAPLAINWGLIIGITAAVIVIGLAIFLSLRRRRSAQA